MTNLRTGPKGSEWKKKSEGRNSVRRTGSSGGSSWRSWRRDSSLEGMSLANLAAFRRLASFSREVAAMDMVFPTMALRKEEKNEQQPEASLGEFAWKSKARGSLWFVCSRVWWKKREKGCLKMVLQEMGDFFNVNLITIKEL